MRQARIFVWIAIAFLLPAAWPQPGGAASIDDLIAAAKKEGRIEFYGPSSLTPQGAQKLAEGFNKKYGLSIRFGYHPSGSMARDTGKVVGLAASGVPPEWDIMVVTDAQHATLWLRKLHQPFDYAKLGVDPKSIRYDNGTVIVANQFVLPAYNRKVLAPKEAPRSWEDLLDPKWKGGKLGMITSVHNLARLATGWGEEKATRYVNALAAQQPFLGTQAEIYTRLQLGEIVVAIMLSDSFVHRAKVTGAPIVHAEGIEPVISPDFSAGVLKGARRPNVAHLFATFFATREAQEIWETFTGETSAFVAGTPASKFAQGKKVLYMTQDQAEMVDRLTSQYGKILGF